MGRFLVWYLVFLDILTHLVVLECLLWDGMLYTTHKILMILGSCYVYFFHSSHVMTSNNDKEWVSSSCNNGDNSIVTVEGSSYV